MEDGRDRRRTRGVLRWERMGWCSRGHLPESLMVARVMEGSSLA